MRLGYVQAHTILCRLFDVVVVAVVVMVLFNVCYNNITKKQQRCLIFVIWLVVPFASCCCCFLLVVAMQKLKVNVSLYCWCWCYCCCCWCRCHCCCCCCGCHIVWAALAALGSVYVFVFAAVSLSDRYSIFISIKAFVKRVLLYTRAALFSDLWFQFSDFFPSSFDLVFLLSVGTLRALAPLARTGSCCWSPRPGFGFSFIVTTTQQPPPPPPTTTTTATTTTTTAQGRIPWGWRSHSIILSYLNCSVLGFMW